jgi:hypothetical protein
VGVGVGVGVGCGGVGCGVWGVGCDDVRGCYDLVLVVGLNVQKRIRP